MAFNRVLQEDASVSGLRYSVLQVTGFNRQAKTPIAIPHFHPQHIIFPLGSDCLIMFPLLSFISSF